MSDPAQYATIAEVASLLRVSPKTIRRMIARGTLEARRFGPRLVRIDTRSLTAASRPLTMARGDS